MRFCPALYTFSACKDKWSGPPVNTASICIPSWPFATFDDSGNPSIERTCVNGHGGLFSSLVGEHLSVESSKVAKGHHPLTKYVHCLTKNLPWRFVQLAVRNSWWPSLLARLARVLVRGSLPLATAPQRFPAERLVCSACRAEACGFVMADSVQERGAATPGRCPRGYLATNQDRNCSHSPSKGSLWVRRQTSSRFLRSCSR